MLGPKQTTVGVDEGGAPTGSNCVRGLVKRVGAIVYAGGGRRAVGGSVVVGVRVDGGAVAKVGWERWVGERGDAEEVRERAGLVEVDGRVVVGGEDGAWGRSEAVGGRVGDVSSSEKLGPSLEEREF